jgi:hypothetical protein
MIQLRSKFRRFIKLYKISDIFHVFVAQLVSFFIFLPRQKSFKIREKEYRYSADV